MAKNSPDQNGDGAAAQAPGAGEADGHQTAAPLADLSSIGATLADSLPDVQEHAIAQAESEQRAAADALVDVDGNPFDPAVHKVSPDGSPTLSTKGKLIKKAGRKAGSGGGMSQVVVAQTATTSEQQTAIQARQAGAACAGMIMQLGIMAGGEEWRPIKDDKIGIDEKFALENAFGDYFVAKNWADFPPGIALTVAVLGYALPRFTMPVTKEKTKRAGGGLIRWFKQWRANRELKKHALKAVPDDAKKVEPKAEVA